jgi:VanZ family protein
LWFLYAVAWSLALLTPQPVELADYLLGERGSFFSGKVVHVMGYAGFAILTGWLPVSRPVRWLLACFLSLHGMGTELLQHFIPLRVPSWKDVALDHLGIVLGMALSWKFWLGPSHDDLTEHSSRID